MMGKEALKRQSTSYLELLEIWALKKWQRRLKLVNETTNDLWLIRKVLKKRKKEWNDITGITLIGTSERTATTIRFPRDEDKDDGSN